MNQEQKITSSFYNDFSQDSSSISSVDSFNLQEIENLLEDAQLQPNDTKQSPIEPKTSEEIQADPQSKDDAQGDDTQEQEQDQEQESDAEQPGLSLTDVVVSRANILFGQEGLIPGSVEEVDFSVSLNFRNSEEEENCEESPSYILRIIAHCKNEEFDDLDEYVFSVRSNNCYEYYEEIRFKIQKGERADLKIAVKVPCLQRNYTINGVLEVSLADLEPIYVPIVTKCVIPEIECLKMLYNEEEGVNVIKVPAKRCQRRIPPIPFKNNSSFNLSMETEAISNENYANKPFDIIVQNFVNCAPNSQFFLNLQLRENSNFSGTIGAKETIRKILLLKVRSSSFVFHFPIEIVVFEGQVLEGN